MKEPKRLRDQSDLPAPLQAALQALEQNTTPPEIVGRVQRSLGGLSSTTGATAAASSIWGSVATTIAAVSVVAALVAWVQLYPRHEETPARPSAAVAHSERLDAVDPKPERGALAAPVAAVPASAPAVREMLTLPVAAPAAAPPPQPKRQRALRVDSDVAPADPRAAEGATRTNQTSSPESAPRSETEPAAEVDATQRQLAIPTPPPEDEASVVYRAKRLTRTDPSAAWRLIESHENYFPDGALVEEREVLAVDLLRRMGRGGEAKQRAARFISRFPRSGYRRTLEKLAAEPE